MPPRLLVIVGETASGKSALALDIARKYKGELICADSWTVRRKLDIGTAKPSGREQAAVPHHLLDIVEPDEDFTAAVFKHRANEAINEISERHKIPILVGGTGLYIDGILYDYNFLPAGDRVERQTLNALGVTELLTKVDLAGFDLTGTDIHNKRRLIRILETNGAVPTKRLLRNRTLVIGLRPDRELLRQRIELRVQKMFNAGLQQEVQMLADRYGWDCEGLKGIGYREWQNYLLGSQSLEQTQARIISSTMHLAKKQRTWFKRNKSIHWQTTPVNYAHIDDLVTTFLNN